PPVIASLRLFSAKDACVASGSVPSVPHACRRLGPGPLAHRSPVVVLMDAVEHLDLLRREDLPPFYLHLGLSVHKLKFEAVQLLLLREKGCLVRLGISEELPYLDPLDADVILEVVDIGPETLP